MLALGTNMCLGLRKTGFGTLGFVPYPVPLIGSDLGSVTTDII
jgi:hypothetical protein